jgi:UDP-N-acetylmuramoyl-tripeptide--D-alanyl-D-alanine ligase
VESLREIAEANDGRLLGSGEARPGGVSIDSRTLKKGDLFFAIVGANHDGHVFVREALERGAAGAVVSDAGVMPEGGPGVVVKDTTRALQDSAAGRLRRLDVKVVGITGSSGKTTTKEMMRQVLSGSFSVMASRGNLNNLYGLPLSLFDLEEHHQVAVLEMGISTHNEMKRLAEIADPDVGILTNLHGAHLVHFDNIDDYAQAKAELFEAMRPNTTGIFNNDDERCRRIASGFQGYAATFGMDSTADFTASEYQSRGLEGSEFTVTHSGRSRQVRLGFAGSHNAMNALAALSAGFLLGCDLDGMARDLESLEPLDMRGKVIRLAGGVRILDDSYNANPAAMRAALAVLSQTDAGEGRRIAVVGDMLELGEEAEDLHRDMGRVLAASGIDLAWTVGPLARHLAQGARESGFHAVVSVDTAAEAAARASGEIRPGDVVLVKASRSVGLDRVVVALRERIGEEPTARGGA